MQRNNKIVLACVLALALVIAVFAYLNRDNIAEKKALAQDGNFRLVSGDTEMLVSMGDLDALGQQAIAANYKTNGKDPIEKTYTGVPLKAIFDKFGIDIKGAKSVSFTAADGYASALPLADALDEDSCFIVTLEDGQPLGSKESGGKGPFMMIVKKDAFSQRWCKFLLEVTVS